MDHLRPRVSEGVRARSRWSRTTSGAAETRPNWLLFAWLLAAIEIVFMFAAGGRIVGFDSHAYWLAWHHSDMYALAPNQQDAYLYSPIFAQVIWPLAQLPWFAFLAVWTATGFGLYVWLLSPLGWKKAAPLVLLAVPQAVVGNLWPLFALVLVAGLSRPVLWAIPLLTKVTAAQGLVWFAVRREWRSLARVSAVTALLVGLSFAASPQLWLDWIRMLLGGGHAGVAAGAYDLPLWPRVLLAGALTAWGAATGRVWLLVASVGIGSPTFPLSWLLSNLAVFAAMPRLNRNPGQSHHESVRSADLVPRLTAPERTSPS